MKFYPLLVLSLGMFLLSSPGFSQALDSTSEQSRYYVKAQFAGDLGLVSAGLGREFFRGKLQTDLSLGYLPEQFGGDRLFTLGLKGTVLPFKPIQIKAVDWHFLTTGAQLGYTLGDDYFLTEKWVSKYPNGYYWFSTALRLYLFVGGQVNFTRVEKLNRFAAYYEVGTLGEYVISYVQNPEYLSPGRIFHLALGVKMRL